MRAPIRLKRDPVTGGYTATDGRFTVVSHERRAGQANRWLVHDTTGRARWPVPLVPAGNSQAVVEGLAAARWLIVDQLGAELVADTETKSTPYELIDLGDYCGCRGQGVNDPMAVVCGAHEALDDVLGAIEAARVQTLAAPPCRCWLLREPERHDGHCCFRPLTWVGGPSWTRGAEWLDDVLAEAVEREQLPHCHDEEQVAAHRARGLAASRT